VTNWFVNNHLRYEKRNDTECYVISGGLDVGFVLEFDAGDDHNHNASNHGHGPATSRVALDDNNDARGRLLIARAGRGCVCRRHGPVGRLRNSKSCTGFDRPQVRTSDGFVLRRIGRYSRDALRIFEQALLRSGLPLPPPDSLRARSPEAFRHCGDPLVSRPSYCGRSREFLSLACAPFALC